MLPAVTDVPAGGDCASTVPIGTVAEGSRTMATTRPAARIAATAAPSVAPTNAATMTGGAGPVEITSATALPGATSVPADGACEITLPAATVADGCDVTTPTTSPAPVIADVA